MHLETRYNKRGVALVVMAQLGVVPSTERSPVDS